MDYPIVFVYHIDYQYNTLANTFKEVYPKSVYWNRTNSIFDFLYINKPKFFIGPTESFTPEVVSALKKFNIPTILYGVAVPPELSGLARLVIVPNDVPKVIARNIQCENKYILEHAANIVSINNPIYDAKKQLDILAIELQPFSKNQLNILASIDRKHKFRVYLDSISYLPNYAGSLSKNHGSYIYNSKITIDFNNVIKYDVAFNKGFCLTNKDGLYPYFSNMEELNNLIDLTLKLGKAYQSRTKLYEQVLEKHTYFHRLADIFKLLQEDALASQSLESIKRYIW
jgi:hypothetical protein